MLSLHTHINCGTWTLIHSITCLCYLLGLEREALGDLDQHSSAGQSVQVGGLISIMYAYGKISYG